MMTIETSSKVSVTVFTHSYVFMWADLIYDEDSKLFGLLQRYSDESEAEELRSQMVAYIKTQKEFDMGNELKEYE